MDSRAHASLLVSERCSASGSDAETEIVPRSDGGATPPPSALTAEVGTQTRWKKAPGNLFRPVATARLFDMFQEPRRKRKGRQSSTHEDWGGRGEGMVGFFIFSFS